MSPLAAQVVSVVLYSVCLAGTMALSIVAALRDRKTMLAAGVIGSCVAVGLLLVEVSRLPGVDLGKPIRSLQPPAGK